MESRTEYKEVFILIDHASICSEELIIVRTVTTTQIQELLLYGQLKPVFHV